MGKGIKTRETKQNIKVHDSAVNVADRVKNIGVKSKEAASESINQTDNVSPEQYASDKISDAIKSGTETAAVGTKKLLKMVLKEQKRRLKKRLQREKKNQRLMKLKQMTVQILQQEMNLQITIVKSQSLKRKPKPNKNQKRSLPTRKQNKVILRV